jgi:hypothetical protein
MVIDAHNHPDWHGHDLDRHLENRDRYGIDKCWILSWECPDDGYDPAAYNKAMLQLDKHGPIPFAGACRMLRGRGTVLCSATRRGLPVTVHIDYEFASGGSYPRPNYWYGGGIEPFERAVAGCPNTIFIGHAPGFWGHLSAGDRPDVDMYPTGPVEPGGKVVEMMRTYANLWCDLSAGSAKRAMQRNTEYTLQFLLEFQDRILYGRDDFDNDQQELLRGLGLPDDVLTKILSDNALKLAPL